MGCVGTVIYQYSSGAVLWKQRRKGRGGDGDEVRVGSSRVELVRVEGGSGQKVSREKRDGQESMTGNTVAVPTFY